MFPHFFRAPRLPLVHYAARRISRKLQEKGLKTLRRISSIYGVSPWYESCHDETVSPSPIWVALDAVSLGVEMASSCFTLRSDWIKNTFTPFQVARL